MIVENVNDDITNILGVRVSNFSELDLRRKSVVAIKDVRANCLCSAQVTHTPRNVTRNSWLAIHGGTRR